MSRGATVGLISSEAWFIYLTFRYRNWGEIVCRGRESHCRGLGLVERAGRARESDCRGRESDS
ncbi:MAG: hypothetical protein ACK56F_30770 [bacterium]|jgi:hypothetical protein